MDVPETATQRLPSIHLDGSARGYSGRCAWTEGVSWTMLDLLRIDDKDIRRREGCNLLND